MVVAQQHGAVTTVEMASTRTVAGWPQTPALFSGHADAPEKVDKVDKVEATRHREPRLLVSCRVFLVTNEPATSAVDRDRASLLRRADLALVDRDREHPVLERCFDRILVGVVRQVQGTLKAAVGALHTVEATFLLLLFLGASRHAPSARRCRE